VPRETHAETPSRRRRGTTKTPAISKASTVQAPAALSLPPPSGLASTLSPTTVFPGQPFTLSWNIREFGGTYRNAVATASLTLGPTTIVFAFPPQPFAAVGFQQQPLYWVAGTSQQLAPEPTDPGGKVLYTFGTHTLRVVVEVGPPGSDATQTFTTTVELNVVPLPVSASWWQWLSPSAGQTLPWGAPYGLMGRMGVEMPPGTTPGAFPIAALGLVFTQQELNPNLMPSTTVQANPNGVVMEGVVSQGTTEIGSVPILWNSNNWPWDTLPGVVTGDTQRTYQYTLLFTLFDAYGNVYPQIASTPLNIVVQVPGGKISAQKAGADAFGTAMTLYAAAALNAAVGDIPGAGALTAAATIAMGIASACLSAANDPPQFDPAFQIPVHLPAAPEPPPISGRKHEYQGLFEFTAHVLTAVRAVSAIGVAKNRALSARAVGNTKAAAMQTNGEHRLRQEALEATRQVLASVPEAIKDINRIDPVQYDTLLRRIVTEGPTPELTNTLGTAAISEAQRAGIISSFTPDQLPRLSPPLDRPITATAVTLVELVEVNTTTKTG
jgi:hypothetical protein